MADIMAEKMNDRITIRTPDDVAAALWMRSKQENTTKAAVVLAALRQYLGTAEEPAEQQADIAKKISELKAEIDELKETVNGLLSASKKYTTAERQPLTAATQPRKPLAEGVKQADILADVQFKTGGRFDEAEALAIIERLVVQQDARGLKRNFKAIADELNTAGLCQQNGAPFKNDRVSTWITRKLPHLHAPRNS